nr:TonB-dependent receptor [uncultured Shinella sp.]
MLKSKTRLLAGAVMFASATAAHAQDAGSVQTSPDATSTVRPSASEASVGIEDIVVTARRRAENMQTVPISVTAITDTVLREKSISTPYDLVAATPGIAATTGSASRNDVLYFIRGQGATFGSSPSVVTYFADVPQQTNAASGGSNINFYDLESVQVLKGPQGTLFGRSTTGGAVLVTPKKPSGEFDGFVEASVGNHAARELTAAINIPLMGDQLAVRIAGNYSYHDGYSRSSTTGQELDDRNRSSYRISLLARPTDWLTNTTIFTDQNISENGTATLLDKYEPNGIARLVTDPRLPFNPAFGGNTVLTGSLLDTRPGGIGTGGFGFIAVAGLCGNPGLAPYLASIGQSTGQCISQRLALINAARSSLDSEAARLAAGGSVRRVATTRDQFLRSRVQQIINTTELDFGRLGFLGETSFKNIFSTTRNLKSAAIREIQGGVGTGVVFNNLNINYDPTQMASGGQPVPFTVRDDGTGKNDWFDVFSEEAQLSGRINDRHDWIVGFFTEEQNTNQYQNEPAVFQTLNGAFTIPAGLPGISSGYNKPYKLSQSGYFAQTTVDFGAFGLDGLRFTAGYRHSIVKSSTIATDATLLPTGLVPSTTPGIGANLKQTADSYTFALDYRVTDRVLVYGTTRRGFKQGGINIQSVVPASNGITAAQPTFGPEKVTDYEVGLKADYDLGGVAARSNIALFTADFGGLHRASSFFNGQTTSNQILAIAALRSRGVEIEQTLRLSQAFTTNVSYAYLDSKFTKFPGVVVRPTDGAVIDRINSPVTGAPKHKFDITGRYLIEGGADIGDFILAANLSYQSRTKLEDDGLFNATGPVSQSPYALANLRLDWNQVMGNPIDASIFVRNLTNKTYKVGTGGLTAAQLGTTTSIYADPRIYGLQIRARFGRSAER